MCKLTAQNPQVGYSGINVMGGGGGGVRRIFLGLKFSTLVFFWVEDLTVYLFESEKSARIFLCIFLGLKCPALYFFGCTI